jgi:hypothetical protein
LRFAKNSRDAGTAHARGRGTADVLDIGANVRNGQIRTSEHDQNAVGLDASRNMKRLVRAARLIDRPYRQPAPSLRSCDDG